MGWYLDSRGGQTVITGLSQVDACTHGKERPSSQLNPLKSNNTNLTPTEVDPVSNFSPLSTPSLDGKVFISSLKEHNPTGAQIMNNIPFTRPQLLVLEAISLPASKDALMSLRGEEALEALVYIQKLLDKYLLSLDKKHERQTLRRFLVRLAKESGILPRSMFLHNVSCEDRNSVAGGAFADIFYGTLPSGNPVALKRLRIFSRSAIEGGQHAAFCREALVWKQLHHPNILPFLGVDSDTFKPYLCMVSPWMQNGNLISCMNSRLEKSESVPFYNWITQIAQGLAYLHNEDVVHGDLRGANIMIDSNLKVKLVDFGLALFTEATYATLGSIGGGSTRWTAPEIIFGSRSTFQSDIYAFGCVSLELDTGSCPFPNIPSDAHVVVKIIRGERLRVQPKTSRIPQDVWQLVAKCWKDKVDERPSAEFIVRALIA